MTVEEFSIKLNVDTADLKKQIQDLKKQLEDLANTGSEDISDGMDDTAESAKNVKKESAGASQSLGGMGKTVGKLAAVASVVALIGKALKTVSDMAQKGVKNLYAFSVRNDKTFANTLDAFSSKKTVITNQLGSITSTLIESIMPYINKVMDWLIEKIGELSKLIAQLFGMDYYYEAQTDVMSKWDSNLNKTKMLISGLDELNILQKNDGTGAGETGTANMFKKVKLEETGNSFLSEIKNKVKKIFDNITGAFEDTDLQKVKNSLKTFMTSLSDAFSTLLTTIEKITASDSFKAFVAYVTDLFNLIVNSGTFVIKFIGDLFKWLNGEITFKDFMQKTVDNFTEYIIKPFKDLWLSLKVWWYKLLDELEVGIYNVFHANDKKTHGSFYAEYQNAYMEKYGTYANGYSPTSTSPNTNNSSAFANSIRTSVTLSDGKKVMMTSDNAKLYNLLAKTKTSAEIKSEMLASGMTAAEFKERFGYAHGGVISSPTLGLLGEYAGANTNPEIITPTSLLDDRLTANNNNLISAYTQIARQIIQAINNVDMSVNLDSGTIARASANGNNSYYKLTGNSLIR